MCDCCEDKPAAASPVVRWSDGPARLTLLGGPPETSGMRSGRMDLGPGEEVGLHNTGTYEEALVIVEGSGVAELAGVTIPIEAGQLLYVPPRTPHNIRNIRAPRLRYLYIVAPAFQSGKR
jgi:mannose-6-phosphate isomerase-like protein (cupin superfamily)